MLASREHSGNSASLEDVLPDNLAQFETFLRGYLMEQTIKNYLCRINQVVKVLPKDPSEWTVRDCEDFMRSSKWSGDPNDTNPERRGWKRATKTQTMAALKSYWEFHHRSDLVGPENLNFWKIPRQPGGDAKYQKLKKITPNTCDVSNFKKVCRETVLDSSSVCQVWRHYLSFLPAEFGIRVKAVCNLRVCDFKLDEQTLFIYKTKGDKSRNIHIEGSIGDVHNAFLKARSTIIERLLVDHKDFPDVVKRLENLRDDPNAWLFFTRYTEVPGNNSNVGRQMPGRTVSEMIRNVVRPIIGRTYSPHAFRHAKAFELLEVRRMKEYEVMNFMGHENIQTTLNYVPLGIDEQRKAFERTRDNGNGGNGRSVDTPPNGYKSKLETLKDLHDRGILNDAAFGAAVAKILEEN